MDKDIIKKLHEDIQEYLKSQANSGEKFNVFDAMSVRTSELAWSALIACLLDPKREHHCGDVFLKSFLNQLSPVFDFDTKSAKVHKEYVEQGKLDGRIDIMVIDEYKRAIIIENKIFASDRPEQISRYYHYAVENLQDFRLLYLTRFGSEPSKESTCDITDFYCISYIDTIKRWLEECGSECIDRPRVLDFINQAKEAINNLCRQTIVDDYIRHLVEESLNINGMKMCDRIGMLQSYIQGEYPNVSEQCTKLVKQYRKEQFDELITLHFRQMANIQPLEGVLDGYWCCKATFGDNKIGAEIDDIFVMHDWEGNSLYCGIEFNQASGGIYNALLNQAKPYIDSKNDKRMVWQVKGLDDFEGLYKTLDEILKIVCKIS